MRLGDLCDIRIGRTPDRGNPAYWHGDLPWATISDMITSPIITTRESIAQLAAAKLHLRPVEPGTLLYSFKLTIGRMAIAGRAMYTNEAIAALVPKGQDVSTEYLRLALLTVPTDAATHAVKGRTLNSASLADLVVPIVEPTRQPRFVEKLSAEIAEASAIHHAVSRRSGVAVRLPQAILERTFPHEAVSPGRRA